MVGLCYPLAKRHSQNAEGEGYVLCVRDHVDHLGSLVHRLRVGNRIWDHILMAYNTGLIGGISNP